MARKPHVISNAQREARNKLHDAAPQIGSYGGIEELNVEMKFFDPEGKLAPSPRGRLFAADMHAYFDFACPVRECTGGGFDATTELQGSLKKRRDSRGKLTCQGKRPRGGNKPTPCNLELHYVASIRDKTAAAA